MDKIDFSLLVIFSMNRCARCGKVLENARDIRWAREGNFMGKILCPTCRAKLEQNSKNAYREQMAKRYPGDPYEKDVY